MKLKNPFAVYRGLSPSLYVMALTTLVNGMGQFVYPFLVLYLTTKLGYTSAEAGIYMTACMIAYVPGMLIGGKLADKASRKGVMIASQTIMSGFFIACTFLEDPVLIPLFIMLALFADGFCDPARSALLQDITTPENRRISFSLTYLCHNLGYIVGPLMAGFLFYSHTPLIFFGNGLAGLITVVLVLFFVKESKPDERTISESLQSSSADKAETGGIFRALFTRPRLLILALSSLFVTLAYSAAMFGLPLILTELFGEDGATLFGTMNSINGLTVVLFTTPLVALLKTYKPLTNISLGRFLFFLGFASLFLLTERWEFFLAAFIYTIGEVINQTNVQYYVANNTPISHRARFSAVLPLIEGAGNAAAPTICGLAALSFGTRSVFALAGISALIGFLITLALRLTDRP